MNMVQLSHSSCLMDPSATCEEAWETGFVVVALQPVCSPTQREGVLHQGIANLGWKQLSSPTHKPVSWVSFHYNMEHKPQ